MLNSSLTIDVPHPPVSVGSGEEYEVIGVQGLGVVLPPRPPCPRGTVDITSYQIFLCKVYKYVYMIILGTPLSQEQWNKYKDPEGRILNPQEVKEVIFRGVCIELHK